MSTIKVNTIDNEGGAVDFPNKLTVRGNAIERTYTSSGTEPSSPSEGDFWYDTGNEVLKQYINSEFKTITTVIPPVVWYGSRALIFGGANASSANGLTDIDYYDIATTGNAADFGNLNVAQKETSAVSDGTRAVSMGFNSQSPNPSYIEYVTCATAANATATSFGITGGSHLTVNASASNGTYGYTMGGHRGGSPSTIIDYITIQSLSNATDHGDITYARYYTTGANDATLAVTYGGFDLPAYLANNNPISNIIDKFTMSTSGNATDFGDISSSLGLNTAGCGDLTRGVFAGGRSWNPQVFQNNIDYITFQSAGNSTDFGDLTVARGYGHAASDITKASFSGGQGGGNHYNIMDYVTIQTTGNATDHGDLTVGKHFAASTSGNAS